MTARRLPRPTVPSAVLAIVTALSMTGADAATPTVTPSGYDISAPQCSGSFPTGASLGIVGVNDGLPYSANPCLGTDAGPSELQWAVATGHPEFYANTADPGPAHSSHWPAAGSTAGGRTCAGDNSPACSFVYGYDAALDSISDAQAAASEIGADPGTATAGATWWLDVEDANSWQTLEPDYGQDPGAAQANDIAALQGAVAALRQSEVAQIGFYSNATQWTEITGGTGSTFASAPEWVTLAHNDEGATGAAARCAAHGFAGGPIRLSQYPGGGFDADYVCPTATTLTGPKVARSGSVITLTGHTGPVAGVTLQAAAPGGRLRPIVSTTADAAGNYTVKVRVRATTDYAAVAAGRRSTRLQVGSNPAIAGPSHAGGRRVRVHGTARPGHRLTLLRLTAGHARPLMSRRANRTTGSYSFRLRITPPERLQVRDGSLTSKVLTIRR